MLQKEVRENHAHPGKSEAIFTHVLRLPGLSRHVPGVVLRAGTLEVTARMGCRRPLPKDSFIYALAECTRRPCFSG